MEYDEKLSKLIQDISYLTLSNKLDWEWLEDKFSTILPNHAIEITMHPIVHVSSIPLLMVKIPSIVNVECVKFCIEGNLNFCRNARYHEDNIDSLIRNMYHHVQNGSKNSGYTEEFCNVLNIVSALAEEKA